VKTAKKYDTVRFAWVIRAGINGSADSYFMDDSMIVLKDPGLGDLSKLEANRQSFYEAYRSIKPHDTHAGIAGIGGKFFRFVHEMQVGDIVLYPSLRTREVYVGEIKGKYRFVDKDVDFPHQRKVQWIISFPKTSLSKTARYEIGAARTLFKYQKHLDEILEKLSAAGEVANVKV